MNVCMYVGMCVSMCECMYVCMHVSIDDLRTRDTRDVGGGMYVCTCVCMYVCVYVSKADHTSNTYMHIHTHTHAYMYRRVGSDEGPRTAHQQHHPPKNRGKHEIGPTTLDPDQYILL